MSGLPPPPAPTPAPRRRRGCIGCLVGCLLGLVLLVGVMVAGVFVLQRMFPTQESVEAAVECAILRLLVENAERAAEESTGDPAQDAQVRRGLAEIRAEYESQCQASPLPVIH